jgi:aquaporin Z
MVDALKNNWKVYGMEAACLGIFMTSASVVATILEYPGSVVHHAIPNDSIRLAIMAVAMGLTAIGINYSPMGKLSGAHMNPAVTLSFLGLKKIKLEDAVFYLLFQITGGVVAVSGIDLVIGSPFEDSHVNYVVTIPGKTGDIAAFVIETMMAFGMMLMVLCTSNHPSYSAYTGLIAGVFVTAFIILSASISGFSINPARTIASAVPSGVYTSIWIYMTAPFVGMFSAAAAYKFIGAKILCAKIHHDENYRCIFNCSYKEHLGHIQRAKNSQVTAIGHGPSSID